MAADEASALRDNGAALALDAEESAWYLEQAIAQAAAENREFDSDFVWIILEGLGIFDLSHQNSMGGAFLKACHAGIIEPTDRVNRSTRTNAHRRKVTVWKSLIFKEQA